MDAAPIEYRELAPDPRLRPWVRCYWILRQREAAPGEPGEPLVPDGTAEVIFHLGEPAWQADFHGVWRRQPPAVLAGEIQRPVVLRSSPGLDCVGIRLEPGALRLLFPCPPRELIAGTHDLRDLWPAVGSWAARLAETVDGEEGDRDKAACLDALVVGRLRAPRDPRTDALLTRLRASTGLVAIETLAVEAGLSRRQLERRLTPAIGIPPKRLARVLRFHRAFGHLLAGSFDAALEPYFDHSHLLRDFRDFAGSSPSALLGGGLDLNRELHRRERGQERSGRGRSAATASR